MKDLEEREHALQEHVENSKEEMERTLAAMKQRLEDIDKLKLR